MRRRVSLGLLGAGLLALFGAVAWAFWTIGGAGSAGAGTGTLRAATDPTASALINTDTVSVAWSRSALGTGQSATGYYITRIRDSDSAAFPACGTSASIPTTALACDDQNVVDGSYHYVVTSAFGSWTAVSQATESVSVVNDSSLPSIRVTSITPSPNGNGWNNASPVVVNLAASDVSGISAITYTIDSDPPVIVQADTAAVSVSGDGIHTVTFFAEDTTGRSSNTQTANVRIDRSTPPAPSAPTLVAANDTGASSTDNITNATAPTFTGTAENGSTVILYNGSAVVGSGVASADVYTIKSSTLVSGAHSMSAQATDIASNTGPTSAITTVTIDTTAPTAPSAPALTAASDSGTSSTDKVTNVTAPSFTGTAENGSTVTLYSSSTAIGSAVATSGTYSVTSRALVAGVKPITVTSTDVAGNVSAASAVNTITIDTTAPSKPGTPVLPAASDTGRSSTDKNTKVTAPPFTGSTTSATTTTLYDGTTIIASGYTATTAFALSSSTLADGSHIITAKATDSAGNLSAASSAITVITDTIAPVATSTPVLASTSDTGKSTSDRITNKTTPVFTGTNESKAIVTLYEGANQLGAFTPSSTAYSVTSSVLANGTHTVAVTPTDTAGNTGPLSGTVTITVDTVAPVAPSTPTLAAASDTGSSSTDGITKTTAPTFTGTAEVGATVGLVDGATATGTAVTATGGTYSTATSTLSNSTHSISAKTTDVAGNVSPLSSSVTIVVDTVLPTVTLNQASGQADPTTASPVDYTVTFSENVVGFTNTDITHGGTAGANTAVLGGNGPTYDALISGMTKSGTVIPNVAAGKATDIAGNLNSTATYIDNTVTYTDDASPAAPSAPTLLTASDSGSSSGDRITKVTTPTFTGTAEVGSTVKLLDGATQVGSVVATGGTYSIVSTALTNGTHTITATATDPSTNVSPASDSTTVTIDTVVPTVTMNQASGQSDPTTASPINFTVIFNESVLAFTGTGLTLSGTAAPSTTAIIGSGTLYNVAVAGMTRTGTVIPALAAGAVQDIAGNLSATATYTDHTVTYTDNVAPGVAISGFTPGADTSQAAMTSGTAGFGPGDNLTVTVVLYYERLSLYCWEHKGNLVRGGGQLHQRNVDRDHSGARISTESVRSSNPDRPHR